MRNPVRFSASRLLLIALCLLFPLWPITSSAQSAPQSPGAQFSDYLTGMLDAMKTSTYQHKTDINPAEGRVNCDCSGLIGYALRKKFPEHYLVLRGELAPWKTRPLAANFYETFDNAEEDALGLWQAVPRLKDAQAGDILSWRKPKLTKGKSTGHVGIILDMKLEPDGRYRVRVLDSTDKARMDDTRTDGRNGFGSGEMFIDVDKDGRPVAFLSRIGGNHVKSYSLLIGRLLPAEKSKAVTDSADLQFIGMDVDAAAKLAEKNGQPWRIISQDGTVVPVPTMRLKPERINAVIKDGKVIRVRRG